MQDFCYILPFTSTFYAQITNQVTIELSIAYYHMLMIWIFVLKFQIVFYLRGLRDGHLFEGGLLLDIFVSNSGRLFKGCA